MEPAPTEILADWFESLPESAGMLLAGQVNGLLPPEIGVSRASGHADQPSLVAWIRGAPRGHLGPIEVAGVALTVAALVDFSFVVTFARPAVPESLRTEHSDQRSAFIGEQNRRAFGSWSTLRRGALSPQEIERWLDAAMMELGELLLHDPGLA